MTANKNPSPGCGRLRDVLGSSGLISDGDWVESKDQDPNGDVRLIQLADIGEGTYLDRSARFLTSSKAKELRCTNLYPGDLLVARMPDPIGRACIFPGDEKSCVTVVDVCIVRPDPSIADPRWLMHAINSNSFRAGINRFVKGTTRQRISRSNLEEIPLRIPPLPEQRRIAAILDQAEALRTKRRAALTKLDTLAQSIFMEMFGDPEGMGWSVVTIEDIAEPSSGSIRTGPFGSQLLHSEFTESGIAVLGIDNAVHNEFCWADRRYISDSKYQQLKRYTVKPGDVLITIMGTCGRCAVVPDDIPLAINTKHLCCITVDRSKCLPEFLHAYFLQHPMAKKRLQQTAKGAIMDGLNTGLIKSMPIPIPPIGLQQEFCARMGTLHTHKGMVRGSSVGFDTLFASLQHRAFRGEL